MRARSTRILVLTCIAFLSGRWVHKCSAAEFYFGPLDPSDSSSPEATIMRGEIRVGDYGRLVSFARTDRNRFLWRFIVLASAGGDIHEAMKIGTFVKATYQSVFVNPAVGKCASACFLIYVAAVDRMALNNSVGIHRPYFGAEYFSHLSLSEAEARHEALLGEVRKYLEKREVPQYLIEKMFLLASDEVYWLPQRDIDRIGQRASWYDQLLVDRCGLNKELERGFQREGDRFRFAKEAKENIRHVAECGADMQAAEGEANLEQILAGNK